MHNSTREVLDKNEKSIASQEGIKAEAAHFFEEFYTYEHNYLEILSIHKLQELIRFICVEGDQEMLIKEVTEKRLKVLFSMPSNKSPGPDGYTSEFFKAVWGTVGKDFIAAVQSFFIKGFLPKGLNATILALLPKTEEARVIKDYRPISCCNLIYKVIEDNCQSIQDHPSTIHKFKPISICKTEAVNGECASCHRDGEKLSQVSLPCAMKINISKAFNSVQWEFVLNILSALNFKTVFIN